MIRTIAGPRPAVRGAALIGVAGVLALAGCTSAPAATDDTEDTTTSESAPATDTGSSDASSGGAYTDGTYTAEGSYSTPESVETIEVTVTLEGDVITAVEVVGDPSRRESEEYQGKFIGGIQDVVVGQDIDEISVSRVAGSSLTSSGFNMAIDEIKAEAAA